jgi:hypothetical protein
MLLLGLSIVTSMYYWYSVRLSTLCFLAFRRFIIEPKLYFYYYCYDDCFIGVSYYYYYDCINFSFY